MTSQQNDTTYRQQLRPFICLIGIDGSGKTAHARILFIELIKSGISCVHVSSRSSLLQLMPCSLRSWLEKNAHIGPRNMTLPSLKERGFKSSRCNILFRIPLSLFFIIYTLLTYLITIRPLLRKYVVVSDRYFYDLFYNLWGDASFALVRMLPKPTIGFLLDLPVPTALSRMHSLEDKKIPQKYYELLRKYYLAIAKQNNLHIIDNSVDFEKSSKCILVHVKAFLESSGKNAP